MSQSILPNSVISHYRIVSKLGAGGMGEVWLAEDTRLGRKVALKLLPAEFTEDSDRVRRFTQEAKAASALNHPNIISVYDIGESETGRFIVMEFVAGHTLRSVIAKDNSLETFFTLGAQMSKALSAAHAAGITHRDIKPDNIMVRADGYVKMLDFGLARLLPTTSSDPEAATLAQQTTPGTVMGTLAYMSPEQASGQTVGSASDIFALGIVMYELATGQHPFKSETMIGYLHAITSQTPPSMTSLKSHLPPALDDLIFRMLEKDVRQRPTASEIAQALQEIEKYGSSNTLPFRVVADRPKATRKEEGFRVAVLPFKVRDPDPDIGVLADGLSEEISTGLSRFRYLSVVTSASAVRLSGETESERSVNAKLGTRYVLEGSIRKGGSVVRVTAQLVDSETGAQLWSENYNRDLQMSTIFDVQDDIAGRIVATVADSYGVLVHSMRAATRKKDDVDLTPVEWQFQYFAYREQITPTAYAELKSRLQRIAERNVGQSDVWACLAQIYVDEYAFGFGGDATSLDRALAAGRRAVELDRANQFALVALAQVHFFRQDLAAFGPAAERGMALNPLNTDALGILGLQIVHTGEFERGTAIVQRAMELNPNHAGWMHFAPLWNHFHKGEYEQALECANRVDVPGLFWPYLVMASACGHLGRRIEAEAAVKDLLALDPEFGAHVRSNVESWHFGSGLLNSILEGLRKAGLEIDKVSETPDKVGVDASTAFPSFEGRPAIAVLPFDNRSNDPEQEYFADGLAEDLITRLSLWRSFPVIARNSSFVYKGKAVDVKKVSADLGVRYLVEGSVRKAGNQVRIAAQLIDASTGQHVWAKSYDRELTDVFAVQDEISGAIAASLVGDLQRAEHQRAQRRAPENLEAWGLYQRALPLLYRFTREDSNQARALLERATALDPQFSTALARLAELGVWDFIFGWTDSPQQTLDAAVAQARRAVDLDPTDAEARSELAFALMTAGFGDEALEAALHGLDLNPCLPFALIVEGYLRNLSGNPPEESIELMKRAMRLSPHDPAEFLFYDVLSAAYMNAGRYAEGLAAGRRLVALLPSYYWGYLWSAMNAVGLGRHEEARAMIRDARQVHPGLSLALARQALGAMAPDVERRFTEALRQAGLEIGDEEPSTSSAPSLGSSETRADEGFWVAVLPFKYIGADADLTALADALSEDIVTGLSRFSYLRVIARSSTSRYLHEAVDVRAAGKELGARYVMEGNLRQSGGKLRLAVQLVDAVSGAHLWAESYERTFSSETVFDLQDDLVPRIVSTVADTYGVLPRSMSEMLRKKSPDQLSPYEAVLRSFGYYERITPEEHAKVTEVLEWAVDNAPEQADCWAMLAMMYKDEHTHGFNVRPDPLGRALAAAQRAVEAAPSNHLAHHALATALFFRREFVAFRNAAERTIALNAMDGGTTAFVGHLMAYAGDWERGCALVEHARQLNPNHPGWYWFPTYFDSYRKRDYRGALEIALKINMPGYFYSSAVIAAAYGQLGEPEAASSAVRQLIAMKPGFAAAAREELGKWFGPGELLEHFLDGLRKAGLEIADEEYSSTASATSMVSRESRADEGFWVAVLPLKYVGSNQDLTALAEGISEEVVTGLSRFSYLRVIARGSTAKYSDKSGDTRAIGKELGARYVMEGSLRLAGSTLRVTVQLIDAGTGVNLWAETYDRPFNSEEMFALQDELVPRIVSTVADQYGALVHSMSESLRGRSAGQYSAHEAVLRSFGYWERMTPEEHAEVRDILEAAVAVAPDHSDCLAALAMIYWHEYAFSYNLRPDPVGRARTAAQRAVAYAPTSHFAHCALATSLFFQKDYQAFRPAAERALALNRMDASTMEILGQMIAYAGDWEYGLRLVERAMQLNPHHPGWYHYLTLCDAYRRRDYRGALESALKVNMPSYHWPHVYLAAVYGQLGEQQRASAALRELYALIPNFGAIAREEFGKWLDAELTEHLLDGLRKAGLEIADEKEEAHYVSSERRAWLPSTSDQTSSAITKSGLTSAFSSSGSFSRPAIVVLPFVNRSPDADNEYFSDGLTEEIISDLSVIKALRVISRNSSMSFKGTAKDTFSIGKELAVSHIVSGSVRKAGDDLRITVELVEVAGDTPLWSDKFSGTIANIFGFQEEISRKIVNALQLRLTEAEAEIIAERPIDNAAAYDCYMRARHEIYLFTAEGLDRAQKFVDSGLSLIGENSLLLATRGMVSWYYVNFSIRPEVKYLDEAAAYASKSLERDPQNCFGIFLRGLVAAKRGDVEIALRDLRTAHELRPGDSMVLNELIRHLSSTGLELNESSRSMFEESLRLDPLHPLNWAQAAWRHFNAGRLAESMEAARRIFQLTDRGNPARVYAAYYLVIANVREEAFNVFDAEGAALAGTAYGSLSLFLSRALRGDAEGAIKHVTPELEQAASWTEYLALLLADGYSFIGHHDDAMRWLRAAVAQGFINYPYLAKCDPLLVSVRSDPRFAELMREVKPRWEALSPSNKLSDELQFVDSADGGSSEVKEDKLKFVGHSSSIAVLPFVNISNDAENEYFCDGLAEELLNALSKIEALRVAARTSAFSFKGKDIDVREIGKKLNVGTVLEGSVRKSGNRLRINAQLVNVEDGYQLWSERYDRELQDVFDIQDEISLAIVDALKVKLLGTEKAAVLKRHTDNAEAYQLYLKGRFFVNQRTSQSLQKAIEYFNQAIAVDPDYALAYAGLTDAYMVLGVPDAVTEALTPLESLSKARAAGEKALQLDDSVAEIYPSLAHIKFKERDWVGAESDYKRGIELNPKYPIAHFYYAVFLASLGRHDEAVKEISLAQELDPLSLPVNASITYVLFFARRYDEAIAAGNRTLELDAAFSLTHQRLGLPYVQKKMYREAIYEFQLAATNSNRAPQPLISLGHAYAVSGNRVEAEKVLVELEEMSHQRYVSPYGIATIHAGMGDKKAALQWLEKAYDEQNTELTFLKVDPRLDPLRDDSRFQELIEKAGFPD